MSVIRKNQNTNIYPNSIVDPEWEVLDPNPDVIALFIQFDDRFFEGKLKAVVVKWSDRMTVCAGLCRYEKRAGMCSISLSVPLLKLRPRKDLVETLIHEMIHAYLFVTNNNRDRDGHGPEFQYHMNRINQETGTNITIYHSFHDEVRLYKTHWWKCNGPCQQKPPFHGLVKRSMNRAPGPNDTWWAQHKATCGGSFIKIKEPENYGAKKKRNDSSTKEPKDAKKPKIEPKAGSRDIRGFFTSPTKPGNSSNHSISSNQRGGFSGMVKNKGSSTVTIPPSTNTRAEPVPSTSNNAHPTQGGAVVRPASNFVAFTGKGNVLGGTKTETKKPVTTPVEVISLDDSQNDPVVDSSLAPCPVCSILVDMTRINEHLDSCLT